MISICLSVPLNDETGHDPEVLLSDFSQEFGVTMTFLLRTTSLVHKVDDKYMEEAVIAELKGEERNVEAALRLLREMSPETVFVQSDIISRMLLSRYLEARKNNNKDDALMIAERAVRFDPEQPTFWGNLANALSDCSRFADADAAFSRMHQLDPQNLQNMKNWASASLQAGNAERLQFCREKMHEIAPGSDEVRAFEAALALMAQASSPSPPAPAAAPPGTQSDRGPADGA